MSTSSQRRIRTGRRVVTALSLAAALAACSGGGGSSAGGAPSPDELNVVLASISERAEPRIADARDVEAIGNATESFALDLYRRLAATEEGNLVLGPYSAWLALAMTSTGAAGATAQELAKALDFPLEGERLLEAINALDRVLTQRSSDEGVTFNVANRLWGAPDTEFLAPFLDGLVKHFGAPMIAGDFAADAESVRKEINRWVDGRTQGKIAELFPAGILDEETKLVLVNAIHLDAPWEFEFDPTQTVPGKFTRLDGTKVQVGFMHYDQYLPSAYDKDWTAVELPYEGGALSMVVIVPRDFDAFQAKFDDAALDRIVGKIKDNGIHLTLPKFSFSTHSSLVGPLKDMGVRSAFGQGADFSAMTAGGGLFIEAVEHEAFIKVDESGTEAAAATGVVMRGSHGPTINVDSPFLFLIRDKSTDATLFLGHVTDPSA